MELEGIWKSQKQIERSGIGRILESSKIDRKKWNWKDPLESSKIDVRKWNWKESGNLKNRLKEVELEGIWKSQEQIEGNGIERNLEF